jgi:hypothetical protein
MTDVTEHYGSADLIKHYDYSEMPHTWSLVGPLGMLVSINLETGEMRFGDNYSPDEAARTFWEAIEKYNDRIL